MRTAFNAFLILSFVGVAVFGLFTMSSGAGHGHDACIAAAASLGFDCQKVNGALSFIALHFDVFRSFSTAIVIILVFAVAIGAHANIYPVLPALAAEYHHGRFFELFSHPFERGFIRWLALHENSPAIA